MNLKLLLCLNIILLIQCTRGNEQNPWSWSDDDKITVKREAIPRVLQRQDNYEAIHSIEQQEIQEFQSNGNGNGTDASLEDVIDEILSSNRQGRNVDGLDDVYSDPSVKEALLNGDDAQARNLIREKLCSLGLMQCEEERRPYPTRVIYTQPPNYNGRPTQLSSGPYRPGPPQPPKSVYGQPPKSVYGQPPNGIYGPPRPMPVPQQPPRKVGYASSSSLNSFSSSNSNSFKPLGPVYEKFGSDFYDEGSASVKFGYTEKPTIVVNQQGKREADVIQSHVHHHYHHVDGADAGIPKTIVVNNPIPVQPIITAPSSEYSSFNGLSSYQNSGYASSGSGLSGGGSSNGFNPVNTDFEYKGVNSGSGPANGIYSGAIPVKPVYEGANQYANQYSNGQNQLSNGQYSQQSLGNQGPAQFTDGNNGLYAQQSNSNGLYSNQGQSQYNGNVGNSFHTSSPDIYKKELNLNAPNRGNSLSNSGYAATQQQLQNTQKYSKNQYNQGEQYQGIESSRQENFDCVCVPYDQCPASDVVGRRDDLILPLDPRHLSTEIEADSDNSTVTLNRVTKDSGSKNDTVLDDHKVYKRDVANENTKQAEGEGVSVTFFSIIIHF